MKELIGYDHAFGEHGSAGAKLGVSGEDFIAEVAARVKMPISKVMEPATKAFDAVLEKLKALIPGSWEDALVEKAKAEFRDVLVGLISEKPAAAPAAAEAAPEASGAAPQAGGETPLV